jgi:CRP-like cAMP-binding protein
MLPPSHEIPDSPGAPASASVVATSPSKAFVFDAARLHKVTAADEATAAALHHMLGRDLALKLRTMNASTHHIQDSPAS